MSDALLLEEAEKALLYVKEAFSTQKERHDKLLSFTKSVARYLQHKKEIDYNLELVAVEAYTLLKELGFENEKAN